MSEAPESPEMRERTRRQFLEGAAAAAAATALASPALAAAQSSPSEVVPPPSGDSPLPAGPGAPYGTYQSEIYVAGMSADVQPIFTTNLSDLEAAAAEVLTEAAQGYFLDWAGGAGAVRRNARALRKWRIVPRMFIDRSERDLTTEVVGVTMPAPVILGPVGGQALANRDGETATAKAATGLELTYVHSSQGSKSIEEVAAAAPQGSRWFGFDWPDGDDPDLEALGRAKLAGCTHLVLSAPQRKQGWSALGPIRKAWDGPIVLSGVQSPAAARMALRRNVDAIVVSNERGRRGSKPRGTINRLPQIIDEVDGRVDVLFGSGVITGSDAFRAIALGAKAVLIGRPYVHGLALAGEEGVRHMLRTLLAELEINLAIAGVRNHHELDARALERE